MEALLAQHPAYDRQMANWLQQRALECWWRPGHPGWSIWPADSEQFIRGVVEAGDAILAPVQIIAPVPATPHASYAQSRLPSGQLLQLCTSLVRGASYAMVESVFDATARME